METFALTEANAGTDASGQQTTAVFDEKTNEWIINGSKLFISNAGYAHVYIIIAMTDKSTGTRGITAFIVEADRAGFSVGKEEKKWESVDMQLVNYFLKTVESPQKIN